VNSFYFYALRLHSSASVTIFHCCRTLSTMCLHFSLVGWSWTRRVEKLFNFFNLSKIRDSGVKNIRCRNDIGSCICFMFI